MQEHSKDNISDIKYCFGCGVCAIICPKKIIDLSLNKDGFYIPKLTEVSACIHCGLCKDICSFSHETIANNVPVIESYAAWSNNAEARKRCSSGGIGYELCKTALQNNYSVCAVRYNTDKQYAEHYMAKDIQELEQSIGSKYIQSYTINGFSQFRRDGKYVVVGTPCQIDSLRRYTKKLKIEDNFILIDFFCHSVPSMLAWKKYLELISKKLDSITSVSWRDKSTGWHDSWSMTFNNSYHSKLSQGDIFYKLFLRDYCVNPACNKNCKFKYNKSSADIRIGDLWGKTYAADDKGTSAVVVFTPKGQELLKQTDCTLIEHPFEIVAEGQMKKNVSIAYTSPIVKHLLHSKNISLDSPIWTAVFLIEKSLRKILKSIR